MKILHLEGREWESHLIPKILNEVSENFELDRVQDLANFKKSLLKKEYDIVLSDYEVIESFRNNGVTYLKADWTKRSKKISKVIESYNRSGIPLYVLYKGDGSYKLLNQILTKKGLINEIEKARLDSI